VQIYFALFVKIQVIDFIIVYFETPACVHRCTLLSHKSLFMKIQVIDIIDIYFETPAYGQI
jgi:hypothetical protein